MLELDGLLAEEEGQVPGLGTVYRVWNVSADSMGNVDTTESLNLTTAKGSLVIEFINNGTP